MDTNVYDTVVNLEQYCWKVVRTPVIAYTTFRFFNKLIGCKLLPHSSSSESGFSCTLVYVSRYELTLRTKVLFEKYLEHTGLNVLYVKPNRLELHLFACALTETGDSVDAQQLSEVVLGQAINFFQLIGMHEVNARVTNIDRKIPNSDRYRKLLPSKQIQLIMLQNEAATMQ